MATEDQIISLRLLISEDAEDVYTDEVLSVRIDTAASLEAVAAEIWTEKAAAYAEVTDISEGGSTRKGGDLQNKALQMAALFSGKATALTGGSGTRISRLRRL